MISYSKAQAHLRKFAQTREARASEEISFFECAGRILSQDLRSSAEPGSEFPSLATSAMDGFAIDASLSLNASIDHPVSFELLGTIWPGQSVEHLQTPKGSAWKIMTGSCLPPGTNACVRIEDASPGSPANRRLKNAGSSKSQSIEVDSCCSPLRFEFSQFDKTLWISSPVRGEQNVRAKGEDFKRDQFLFQKGHVFRQEDLLILATLGLMKIPVEEHLRVALLSTGNELVDASETPQSGQVRNSTLPYLASNLQALGVRVTVLTPAGDDEAAISQTLNHASQERFDLILTSGGISVGESDCVPRAVESIGAVVVFRRVKIRPGKPVLFATMKNGTPILGLPGNPIASMIAFRFFALPFLRALKLAASHHSTALGEWHSKPRVATGAEHGIDLRLSKNLIKKTDGTEFLKAKLSGADSVEACSNQQASLLHPLLESDGWIELAEGPSREFVAGERVKFHSFDTNSTRSL